MPTQNRLDARQDVRVEHCQRMSLACVAWLLGCTACVMCSAGGLHASKTTQKGAVVRVGTVHEITSTPKACHTVLSFNNFVQTYACARHHKPGRAHSSGRLTLPPEFCCHLHVWLLQATSLWQCDNMWPDNVLLHACLIWLPAATSAPT